MPHRTGIFYEHVTMFAIDAQHNVTVPHAATYFHSHPCKPKWKR